ncbi:hypothetical protein EYF80_028948 [Liparis tanakae]|uniref:Uncharacterized protein n=1 Tax=Liparis tanakae TaxID=230148 RepID=A0A4Z2H5E5_9TELE|nr:hypothetical protein EYF80_028948 [Liparis tanakae]
MGKKKELFRSDEVSDGVGQMCGWNPRQPHLHVEDGNVTESQLQSPHRRSSKEDFLKEHATGRTAAATPRCQPPSNLRILWDH